MTTGPNGITRRLPSSIPAPLLSGTSIKKSIKVKTLYLTDVWDTREAIDNKEQDPEILQDIAHEEAIRYHMEADIQPAHVDPLPEFSGTKCKQQDISDFFSIKNLTFNKESIIFHLSQSLLARFAAKFPITIN